VAELEVWLVGDPDQLTAALAALAEAGRITGASVPEPLYERDAGRVRRYLRVATSPPQTPQRRVA
jgi:hypothetical protein